MRKNVKPHHLKKNLSANAAWKARKAERNIAGGFQTFIETSYGCGYWKRSFIPNPESVYPMKGTNANNLGTNIG